MGEECRRMRLQFTRRLGIHAIKLMLVLGVVVAKHPESRTGDCTKACVLDSR